jgi:energy-coupling factor transporter ATP-binding protein EcfA2
MEHLSGGEKTIAALALLFAIHSYQPSPFFVLDEVDAALDNVNVSRVATYVREHANPGMQFIVISLKAGFFQESETLVGVMRDQAKMTSKYLSLDVSSLVCEVLCGVCANVVTVAEVSACLDEWLGRAWTSVRCGHGMRGLGRMIGGNGMYNTVFSSRLEDAFAGVACHCNVATARQ